MATITLPARTRAIKHHRAPKPRFARAGVAALLLALGLGRHTPHSKGNRKASTEALARISAKAFILTLYRRISEDRVMAIAAGVTFYALLAIFPAIAATVSVYGLVADLRTINADLSSFGTILPGGAISIIGEQIKRIASNSHNTLGLAVLVGIAISIWSANAGVKAMFDALNIVLKEEEKRGFIRLNAISLAFTLGGLVLALLAASLVLGLPLVLKHFGLTGQLDWLIDLARWPLLWAGLALVIAFLYRFGPSRNDIPWRWISWGSAMGAFVWLIASMAFSWYAANFGTYNKTYGSLGAVIGFMTWIWISAIIVLVGEELNEMLDKLQHPHKDNGKPHPLGVGRKPPTGTVIS